MHYSVGDAGLIGLGLAGSTVRGPARHPPQVRILVVETDAAIRDGLAKILREASYEALTTTTGEQAFHLLPGWLHPIDLLYMRVALPGPIDGELLAEHFATTTPTGLRSLAHSTWTRGKTRTLVTLGSSGCPI